MLPSLEDQVQSLRQQVAHLEVELNNSYQLKFPWAGNLGRWEWDYLSGQVVCSELKVRAIGFEPAEMGPLVDDWTARIHPEDYESAMNAMRLHLAGELDVYETEYRIRTKDGGYRWFYDRGKTTQTDPQGKPLSIAGVVFDVTERKRIEEQLRASVEFKGHLIAVLSHDIRGPLGAIRSLMESIDLYEPQEYEQLFRTVGNAALKVEVLLGGMLEWARLDQNHSQVSPKPEKLAPIIEEQLEFFEQQAKAKTITLSSDIDPKLLIVADPRIVEVVVRNLISNALKFTPAGGQVSLYAHAVAQGIEVKVVDTGEGMIESVAQSLREFSGSYTTRGTDGETGSGLGLVLCREFLRLSGGSLTIASQPDKGSTFSFVLPGVMSP
jgi:PAS domain S-box-containing protein